MKNNSKISLFAISFSILALLSTICLYYFMIYKYDTLNDQINKLNQNNSSNAPVNISLVLNEFAKKLINDKIITKDKAINNEIIITFNEMKNQYGLDVSFDCVEEDTYIKYIFMEDTDQLKDTIIGQNCYEK